jgi:hypothetical protein
VVPGSGAADSVSLRCCPEQAVIRIPAVRNAMTAKVILNLAWVEIPMFMLDRGMIE